MKRQSAIRAVTPELRSAMRRREPEKVADTPTAPPDSAGIGSKALRGGVLMLGTRLLLQGFTWASTLLVLRLLHPEDYGMIAASMFVIGLAHLIADGGLTRSLVQKPVITDHDVAVAFTWGGAISLAFYAAIYIAAPQLAGYFQNPDFELLFRVMGLTLLITSMHVVPDAQLERELRFGTIAAATATNTVVQAIVALVLAWMGWGVWALGLSILAGKLAYALHVNFVSPWMPRLAWPNTEGRKILAFGMTIAVTNLLWYLNHSADTGVILVMLGPAQLGIYSVAMQLAMIPLEKINVTINNISFAAFSRLHDDPERLRRWFLKLLTIRTVIAFPMLVGLALVADDFLPALLGEKWRPLVPLFQVLAPVGGLMVANTAFTPLFNAIGRPDLGLKFTAVSAIVLSLAFYIGCKKAGLMGVCVAWAVLYPALFVGLVIFTSKASGVGAADALEALAAPIVAVAGMIVAVLAVRSVLGGEALVLVRLTASIVVGGLSFCLVLALVAGRELWIDIKNLRAMVGKGKPEGAPS